MKTVATSSGNNQPAQQGSSSASTEFSTAAANVAIELIAASLHLRPNAAEQRELGNCINTLARDLGYPTGQQILDALSAPHLQLFKGIVSASAASNGLLKTALEQAGVTTARVKLQVTGIVSSSNPLRGVHFEVRASGIDRVAAELNRLAENGTIEGNLIVPLLTKEVPPESRTQFCDALASTFMGKALVFSELALVHSDGPGRPSRDLAALSL